MVQNDRDLLHAVSFVLKNRTRAMTGRSQR